MSEKISHTTENLFNQVRLQIAHFLEKNFLSVKACCVSPSAQDCRGSRLFPGTIRPVWGSKALLGEIAKPSDHAETSEAGDKDVGV